MFDLPTSVSEDFAQSLRAYLVAQTTESWMFWFGLLETFVKEHAHCRVPVGYKTNDGYRLGMWASNQRQAKDTMDPDRRQRLEALPGWSWDVLSDLWEEGFSHLKQFADHEGHCQVPVGYKTDDNYKLGVWINKQRTNRRKMESDRRQRLEELPGWSWDVLSDQWEDNFSHLKKFADQEGHCRVPVGYKINDSHRLGRWVSNQRMTRDKMEPDHRQRLEALPGWSWDVLSDQWEEGFSRLKQFVGQEGHCRVFARDKSNDGYPLGASNQRMKKDKMELDRRQRLEALPGWSWDVLSDLWEEGFSHLKQFADREGHCQVPDGYKTNDGYPLGKWVGKQRTKSNAMDSVRRQHLDALPGWSWGVLSDQWEEGFSHLKQFVDREGHCRVAVNYKTNDGYRLGQWVLGQRAARDKMNSDRRQRLEALPGWSWNFRSDQWEVGFAYLKQFS